MGKIIACVNEKGGVAKTTTIKNLSIGLVNKGKKVLVVDLDPSTSLTNSLGLKASDVSDSILNVLQRTMKFEEKPEDFGIFHQEEGVDIIPSVTELHAFEDKLITSMQRETVLRRSLNEFRDKYDYIFIDCPAGLGIFVVNALFAADQLIIPVQPQFLGVGAMQNLFKLIRDVRMLNGTNVKPEILGILFTMVRINTNNDRDIIQWYEDFYKDNINIFRNSVPHSVRFSESDGEGKSIYSYQPRSSSAMICNDVVNEFLALEEKMNSKGDR